MIVSTALGSNLRAPAYLELLKVPQQQLARRRAFGVLLSSARGQEMGFVEHRGVGGITDLESILRCFLEMRLQRNGVGGGEEGIWKDVLVVICKIVGEVYC